MTLGVYMKLVERLILIIGLVYFSCDFAEAAKSNSQKTKKVNLKKSNVKNKANKKPIATKLPPKKINRVPAQIRKPASSFFDGNNESDIKIETKLEPKKQVLNNLLVPQQNVKLNPLPDLGNTKDVRVVEVRKRLALSNAEKNYKEFFINGGSNQGLKEGAWVTVERRVPVHDPFQNAAIGDMYVPVGDLELIKVAQDLSVARLLEIKNPYFRPILEFDAIMLGDKLNLATLRQPQTNKKERFTLQAVDSEYESLKGKKEIASLSVGMDTDLNAATLEPREIGRENTEVNTSAINSIPDSKSKLTTKGSSQKEIITIPQ